MPEPLKKALGRLRIMKARDKDGNLIYSMTFRKPKLKGALIISQKKIFRIVTGMKDDGTYGLVRIK
jgi:hypothetical protein